MSADKKKKRAPIFGELRPSQIITTFGPGAVVDLPDISVVLAGSNFWTIGAEQEVDEPRLRSLLRVNRFYRPPVKSDEGVGGIPSFVFPRYVRCPRCHRIGAYDRRDLFHFDRQYLRCNAVHEGKVAHGGPLVFPARFVIACSEGHISDFPWFDYVHRGRENDSCRPEKLIFRESTQSAAISELVISCEICRSWRTMEDAFGNRAASALGQCQGARPWLGNDASETCLEGEVRTMLRGASNLYFAVVHSALSVPEWDDPVHAAIASYEEQLQQIDSLQKLKDAINLGIFARFGPFDPAHVFAALQRRREQATNRPTPLDIRREEFSALRSMQSGSHAADREFQIEPVSVPRAFDALIERVAIVRRLREVRALAGFTRIDGSFDPETDEDEQKRYRVQSLSQTELHWRPAVELRGEGIFIELAEALVQRWEQRDSVVSRSAAMERTHEDWRHARKLPVARYPGARFVLLHSLAHLLIQSLALDCGYSSSSIRERIYSSADSRGTMAGILLYTATPDSDGSLGGLADKGRPEMLGPLLQDAIERAHYCSSDPLCGHCAPGEMGHLNGAACHACLLISETSCERGNRYLDRAHVVDTVAQLGTQFF